jgi:proline iminopeptidase
VNHLPKLTGLTSPPKPADKSIHFSPILGEVAQLEKTEAFVRMKSSPDGLSEADAASRWAEVGPNSWGSMIAALAVAQAPERFSAYLAVCQAANAPESERLMYRWVLDKAAEESNEKAASELKQLGPPPYARFSDYRTMTGWIARFSGAKHPAITRWRFVRLALESPFYSWADLLRIPLGAKFSFSRLWREAFYETDLFKQAPRLDVPVFFFLGRHDHTATASAAMAERYFEALEAPRGKRLIWFENSGHWPHLEEPERFQNELIRAADEALGHD